MNLQNCEICFQLFTSTKGRMLCTQCEERERVQLRDLRDFLTKNPNQSIMDLSEQLDISISTFSRWKREGRI